ncbi:hypothetical protein J6590_019022 [Homalodisca vitripennis]|nr:hypothetical protein J6590_019022 [Homalodisca vitripennis]
MYRSQLFGVLLGMFGGDIVRQRPTRRSIPTNPAPYGILYDRGPLGGRFQPTPHLTLAAILLHCP